MRRLLLLAFTAIALVLRPVAAHATQQSVYVWAYGCRFAEARTVSVFMQNPTLFGAAGRQIHVPATIASDGALEFRLPLPLFRPIDIDFTVDGQNCTSGGGGLVVLPGYARHVVIPMRPSLFVWILARSTFRRSSFLDFLSVLLFQYARSPWRNLISNPRQNSRRSLLCGIR